ncbi:uncharacterized protein F5891DRAFT_955327 [Suillus fuscotomentosus]|uniref:Uncharacterized protein n=1 Tax=Suillus fuscotomentosus TaxID=1912939 RepID=A0AAD4E4Y6_9AGAM|nr:uncharacterized protein F5891DRAFT_955327 [Suillus fuscotomentosus]KAG1898579.1 hypothetical protein F5891DRAFT_955327 [Suillus fuscotomentosus]
MTEHDLKVLDTIDSPEYISGELSDDELDIPAHMIPPNPDDSDILPSQVHPSYPYGNPTNIKHPAARPRPPYDPTSRALFEDMGYGGGGVNGSLRWRDLALDRLLPVNDEKEEMRRAAEARKMANGATTQPQQQQQQPPPQAGVADQTIDEEDEEEEDSAEHDENDVDEDNVEDEDDDM